MSGTRAAGRDGERRSSSLSVRGGLWKFTNPHPSTLTCVSLTMETFSLWVGGGITLRRERKKKKKKKKEPFSPLPWSCHFWKLALAQSSPRSRCCSARPNLWLSTVVNKTAATCSPSSRMAAKNTAKGQSMCCANRETRLGTQISLRAHRKFLNCYSVVWWHSHEITH